MSRLSIELGEEKVTTICECCGNETRTVHGFVYDDENAYAVYFAMFTLGHAEKGVSMAIGLGEWDEGANTSQRRSVGIDCRVAEKEVQFSVVDPGRSPWGRTEFLGRMMSRDEALKYSDINEFLHVAEHVIREDPRVARQLDEA